MKVSKNLYYFIVRAVVAVMLLFTMIDVSAQVKDTVITMAVVAMLLVEVKE